MFDIKQKTSSLVVLIVITIIVFYPCLSFDFLLSWDDGWQVFNDYTHNGLSVSNLREIFSSFYMGQYSPFNQLIYTCIYSIVGMNALYFHLVSMCLHIGCVLLVYIFLRQLLVLYGEANFDRINLVSFITAVCVAIHPLQIESVVWISASKVLWCSFFFLCGLVLYLKYIRKPTILRFIMTIFMFVCSFLSKEQAVVFPFCLILIDWTIKRKGNWRQLLIEKIPFLLLCLLFCVITMISYGSSVIEIVDNGFYSIDQRIVFMGYSLTEYVTKLIMPLHLMYMYPFPMQPGETLPLRFYINSLIIIAFIYFLWLGRKNRIFIFGCLFFIIQLALVLHMVSMPRATITADRYLYLACIGFFLPIVWFITGILYKLKPHCKLIFSCMVVYLILLGFYSHSHVSIWENNESLKEEMREILQDRN